MGSCVSISEEDPGSARFRLSMAAKAGEVLAPPPAMGGVQTGNYLTAVGFDFRRMSEEAGLGFRSPRCGTRDETFFDSQECFESDCEDDFFSVNGDLTPSLGSTPIHRTVASFKLLQHEAVWVPQGLVEPMSEPSPKKTLAELLQETVPREPAGCEQHNNSDEKTGVNEKIMGQVPNSLDGTPYVLCTRNGERGAADDSDLGNGKEKKGKAMHCCLPSLVHSLSFSDKKPPSPWRQSDR